MVLGLILLPACNGTPEGQVPVFPVSGQIQFKGKPLSRALVILHPADEAKYGSGVPRPSGRTDEKGQFLLRTFALDDGAPAGSYRVSVSTVPERRSESGLFSNSKAALPTDVLKGRYLDPKKTSLTAEVKEGDNTLPPFDLR
ncbi:hypothetical protein ACYOEI_11815 [Singulisphaera rosea]